MEKNDACPLCDGRDHVVDAGLDGVDKLDTWWGPRGGWAGQPMDRTWVGPASEWLHVYLGNVHV